MNILGTILKAVVAIVFLFIITKLMGKKQISQLNMFDYVIGISIGSIAADLAISKDYFLIDGLIAMAIFALASLFVSFTTLKSIKMRRFLTGYPIVILENGSLIKENLKRIKFDVNDFLQECRVNGYFELSELEYAIMESNGRLSFLPKSKYKPLTPNDMKIKTSYKGLTANLLIDGKIMEHNVKHIGKDVKWLLKRLKNLGYENIDDLLLVTCDTDEKMVVYEKNIGKETSKVLE